MPSAVCLWRKKKREVTKYEKVEVNVVEDLDDTERGNGAFGSTGANK